MTDGSTGIAQRRHHAPSMPAFAVARSRVAARLSASVEEKITVVAAPAGSGKTIAVAQWASSSAAAPVAWLTCETRHVSPKDLGTDLVASLRVLGDHIGRSALRAIRDARSFGGRFTSALLEELGGVEGTIVLDGLDRITDDRVLRELGEIVRRSPTTVRYVLTSRGTAAIEAALDRVGVVPHVGPPHLRLGRDETRLLLGRVSGRSITDRHLDAVIARTDGWAACVQLAGLLLRGAVDGDAAIERVVGADRLLADYFGGDVLGGLPADVLEFLVDTSVLDRLTPQACDDVTGKDDGAQMLARLEGTALLVRDGGRKGGHRYHPLLRQYLRQELVRADTARGGDVLMRAAKARQAAGDVHGAGLLLLEAGAWPDVMSLVAVEGGRMYERGDGLQALELLDGVPVPVRAGDRRAVLDRAVLLQLLGRSRGAADEIDLLLRCGPLTPGELAVVNTLRAGWGSSDHAAPEDALAAGEAALAALDDPQVQVPDALGFTTRERVRALARLSLARAEWLHGQTDRATRLLQEALQDSEADRLVAVQVLGARAVLDAWAGRLAIAGHDAEQAMSLAGHELTDHPVTLAALLAWARVCREQNDRAGCATALDRAAAHIGCAHHSVAAALYAVERALLELADGAPRVGLEHLGEYRSSTWPQPRAELGSRLAAVEIALLLDAGETDAAVRMAGAVEGDRGDDLWAAMVRAALASDDLDRAEDLLARWVPSLDPRGELLHLVCTAAVADRRGEHRRAGRLMTQAVELAEPQRLCRVFLDSGPEVLRVARRALEASHVEVLRAAAGGQPQLETDESTVPALSDRELAVLQYLPTRLSNREIAAELFVSVNTLKTHLSHIYRRLGVTSRREAVLRADAVHLI